MLEECCGKTQPRSVLEVVLIGCDGDLNEAMNEVLSMPPYDAAEMERAAARASAVAAEDAMSGAAAEDDEEEALPYGGDMQAAMKAQDRPAIRRLMRLRQQQEGHKIAEYVAPAAGGNHNTP